MTTRLLTTVGCVAAVAVSMLAGCSRVMYVQDAYGKPLASAQIVGSYKKEPNQAPTVFTDINGKVNLQEIYYRGAVATLWVSCAGFQDKVIKSPGAWDWPVTVRLDRDPSVVSQPAATPAQPAPTPTAKPATTRPTRTVEIPIR